jgi:hypothetical protein
MVAESGQEASQNNFSYYLLTLAAPVDKIQPCEAMNAKRNQPGERDADQIPEAIPPDPSH